MLLEDFSGRIFYDFWTTRYVIIYDFWTIRYYVITYMYNHRFVDWVYSVNMFAYVAILSIIAITRIEMNAQWFTIIWMTFHGALRVNAGVSFPDYVVGFCWVRYTWYSPFITRDLDIYMYTFVMLVTDSLFYTLYLVDLCGLNLHCLVMPLHFQGEKLVRFPHNILVLPAKVHVLLNTK